LSLKLSLQLHATDALFVTPGFPSDCYRMANLSREKSWLLEAGSEYFREEWLFLLAGAGDES